VLFFDSTRPGGYGSGPYGVGGLVGQNYGDVTKCFWDTQTSGQARSGGRHGPCTKHYQDRGPVCRFLSHSHFAKRPEIPQALIEYRE